MIKYDYSDVKELLAKFFLENLKTPKDFNIKEIYNVKQTAKRGAALYTLPKLFSLIQKLGFDIHIDTKKKPISRDSKISIKNI